MKFKRKLLNRATVNYLQKRKEIERNSRLFTSDYCDLGYTKIDNQQPLTFVFFHGFNGSKMDAIKWMIYSPEYNYLSFDMPGYRESKLNDRKYDNLDISKYIETIIELISLEINTEFILMGHSLGAFIASEVSQKLKRKHKLVLVSPVTEKIVNESKKIEYMMMDTVKTLKKAIEELGDNSFVKPKFFFNTILWFYARRFKKNRKINRILLNTTGTYAKNFYFKNSYQKVKVPSAIIYGNKDKIILPNWIPEVQKQLGTENTILIKEAGHIPFSEDVVSFSNAINSLVEKL